MRKIMSMIIATAMLLPCAGTAVSASAETVSNAECGQAEVSLTLAGQQDVGADLDEISEDAEMDTDVTTNDDITLDGKNVEVTASEGDEITVYVKAENAEKALGLWQVINYDSSVLKYNGCTDGVGQIAINDKVENKVILTSMFEATGTDFIEETNVFVLSFTALADISSSDSVIAYTVEEFYDWVYYDYDVESTLKVVAEVNNDIDNNSNFEYVELDDGTIEITAYTGRSSEMVIPSELDGKTVTSIRFRKVTSMQWLMSVTIPDTVTNIGNGSFGLYKFIENVYYAGTEEQWNNITIGINNDALTSSNIHYNCTNDDPSTPDEPIKPVEPIGIYGDMSGDGRISSVDALFVLRAIAGLERLSDEAKVFADVNCDGRVTSVDALEILRYCAGYTPTSSIGEEIYPTA